MKKLFFQAIQIRGRSKQFITVFLILLSFFESHSQVSIVNNGAKLYNLNLPIYLNGTYINADSIQKTGEIKGQIFNEGTFTITGDIINNGSSDFLIDTIGSFIFSGKETQNISGKYPLKLYDITINKSQGELKLNKDLFVDGKLSFSNGNILLNGGSVDLGQNGSLSGEGNSSRIYGQKGVVKARRFISNPAIKDNIAGLGLYLNSPNNFGYTQIIRGHSQQGAADGSIFRYFRLAPSNEESVNSIKVSYFDNEIVGQEKNYRFFFSFDSSKTWTNVGGTVDIQKNEVVLEKIEASRINDLLFTVSPFICTKPPITTLPDSAFLCGSGSKILDAGISGMRYKWTTQNGPGALQTYEVNEEGKYKVMVTDKRGCVTYDSAFVQTRGALTANFRYSFSTCLGDSIRFSNTSLPINGTQFKWSFGEGTTTGLINPSKTYQAAGQYSVKLTASNRFGCKDSTTKSVNIFPLPEADFSDKDTCLGNSKIFLDKTKLASGFPFPSHLRKYEWDMGDGNTYVWNMSEPFSNRVPERYYYSKPGTYIVKLITTSSGECKDTISRAILVRPTGKADPECVEVIRLNIGPDTYLCSDQALQLNAANPGATYQWYSEKGFISSDPKISILDSGKYWVEVTRRGVTRSDTIVVKKASMPITSIFLSSSLVNVGDTVKFISVSYPDPKNYLWNFGDGGKSIEEDPAYVFYRSDNYQVSLIVRNDFCSDTITKEITVRELKESPQEENFFNNVIEAKLYPNPNNGVFRLEIKMEEEAEIELLFYDMNGNTFGSSAFRAKDYAREFNFSSLSNGIFILRMRSGNDVRFYKIVKI